MSGSRDNKPPKGVGSNDNNAPAPDDSFDESEEFFPDADATSGLADVFRSDEQRLSDKADEFAPELTDELPENIVQRVPVSKRKKPVSRPHVTNRVSAPKSLKSDALPETDPLTPTPRAESPAEIQVAKVASIPQEDKERALHTAANLTSYLERLDSLKRQTEIDAQSAYIDRNKIARLREETNDKLHNLQLVFNLYRLAYHAPQDRMVVDAKQGTTVDTPYGPLHFNENITTDAGKTALLAKGQRILDHIDHDGTIESIHANLDAMTARLAAQPETHTHAFFTTRRTSLPAPVEMICNGNTYEERRQDALQKVADYFEGAAYAPDASMSTDGKVKLTPQCKVRVIPVDVHIKEKQVLSGIPMIAKTATVQINDGDQCRSEFYFQDMSLFNKVRRVRSGLTSIPGLVTMEWAAVNLNSFRAKMNNPRETINLDTGRLPRELTEALIIYCKFKDIKYSAPVGYEVSDKQVTLFAEKWAERVAADKSAKKDLELEAKTTFKRPSKL